MQSRRRIQKELNVKKTARFVIAINAMQIAAMAAIVLYALLGGLRLRYLEAGAVVVAAVIVSWGAILDIREALNVDRIAEQTRMLEEAYSQLEDLNGTLRKQRHDFMNHLQVVFSLLELDDAPEAMRYVESVYGDIKRSGSVLKTSIPAVNALIAAKRQDCKEQGIALELTIGSGWSGMPMPGWEMCRILGNLIDNARDALLSDGENGDKRVELVIDETPAAFTFCVKNNGPRIPDALQTRIFQLGFTTKSDGHGSGLSIVRELMGEWGGEIRVTSDDSWTSFCGTIPRQQDPARPEAPAEA